MKDIIITSKKIKQELYILLACFILAVLINVGAIVYYNTLWREILTQVGYELVIAIVLYFIALLIRFVIFLFRRYVFKGNK